MASQLIHIVKFTYSNVVIKEKERNKTVKKQFCKESVVITKIDRNIKFFLGYLQRKYLQKCTRLTKFSNLFIKI